VKIVAYGTNEVRLEASLSHPGILVLADAFYPGWMAYVDGKEERVMRADTMVRAVFVREGRHTIEFSYRPRSFIVGLWLSGVALLVIVFGLLISVRPARNEIAPQTHRKSLNNQKASC